MKYFNQPSEWYKHEIIYQIYPKSFYDSDGNGIGDIPGIIDKLDYLEYLGITMIWLSPVYKSPQADNGYDISDYYSLDPVFGSNDDLFALITKAHRSEIKIMMDLVMNHTSDRHPWFKEALKGKNNPYRDYYIWKKPSEKGCPNNWKSIFGGSAWEYDENSNEYYLHYFLKEQPDLNWENPIVRKEMEKIILWWIDKGIDGFRMDAVNVIGKPAGYKDLDDPDSLKSYHNQPATFVYLSNLYKNVFNDKKVFTIGEVAETTVELANSITSGTNKCMDAVIHFEHMKTDRDEKMHRFGKKQFLPFKLKEIIQNWTLNLNRDAWTTWYLGNHDWDRSVSRFGNDGKFRKSSAKLLACVLLTLRGTPLIYQGDEIGMSNCDFNAMEEIRDRESINFFLDKIKTMGKEKVFSIIKTCTRDNARTPLQWNNGINAGFSSVTPWIKINSNYPDINIADQKKDGNSILNYYRNLIKIKKDYNELIIKGIFHFHETSDDNLFIYSYTDEKESVLIINNFQGKKSFISGRELRTVINFLIGKKSKGGKVASAENPFDSENIKWTELISNYPEFKLRDKIISGKNNNTQITIPEYYSVLISIHREVLQQG